MKKKRYVRQAELAREIGVSRQRIGTLVKRGTLKLNKQGLIDADLAISILDENKNGMVDGNGTNGSYSEARTKHEEFKAKLAELEFKEKLGELVNRDDIIELVQNMINVTKQRLLGIPAKVAPLIIGESSTRKVKVIIETEINQVLKELAKTDKLEG